MAQQKQKTKQKEAQSQSQKQEQVDLAELIDRAYLLDVDIKQKSEELKGHKKTLKEQAEARGVKELEGHEGKINFSDEESTHIDPETLYHFLLDNGFSLENFFGMVKVQVSEAKKQLGNMLLDEVAEFSYKEYSKSSLKKKKKEE